MSTPENIAAVGESMCEALSTWIHRRSQQFVISETSLRRILRKDLGMLPYKVQLVQELKPIDHPMRFRFAKWVCDRLTEHADFGKKKSSFQLNIILILADMQTSKIVAFEAQKHARIHWKADAPKTSHCLVRIGALFLKIGLSAAELMPFGYLGAAIWHRWSIIW